MHVPHISISSCPCKQRLSSVLILPQEFPPGVPEQSVLCHTWLVCDLLLPMCRWALCFTKQCCIQAQLITVCFALFLNHTSSSGEALFGKCHFSSVLKQSPETCFLWCFSVLQAIPVSLLFKTRRARGASLLHLERNVSTCLLKSSTSAFLTGEYNNAELALRQFSNFPETMHLQEWKNCNEIFFV